MNSKLKSRRFLVAVWALVMFSVIIFYSMATKYAPDYLAFVLPSLLGIVLSWVGLETYTKKLYRDNKCGES